MKNRIKLLSPLFLFAVLFLPYCYVNSRFIVKWFGCSCPRVDPATGEFIRNRFNANVFTAYFWLGIAGCVTVISAVLSGKFFKEKKWHRILYVVCMLGISLVIAYRFAWIMRWK